MIMPTDDVLNSNNEVSKSMSAFIQMSLDKYFLIDLMKTYKDLYDSDHDDIFFDYILKSGIIESYNDLISEILPIILSGIVKSDVDRIDESIIIRAIHFIEQEYPVYTKKKRMLIRKYIDSILEIQQLLKRDSTELHNIFGIKNPEYPSMIKIGVGDFHRNGKSVSIIYYTEGKLVYKPRNITLDSHFYEFLSFVGNMCGYHFYCPKIYSRDNYGWEEYIDYEQCDTINNIRDYYARLGFLMCILYTLEATDVHYENIIAKGEFPIIIDLETVCCPYNPIDGAEANQGLYQSILRCGLLPTELSLFDIKCDISGLSNVDGVKSPFPYYVSSVNNSGNISVVNNYGQIRKGQNIPSLDGKLVSYHGYEEEIITGFSKAFNYIINNRDTILTHIKCFVGDEIRVIFRNTVAYTYLLYNTKRINILQDENRFNNIISSSILSTIKEYKVLQRIVQYEIEDLKKDDIPYFSSYTNSLMLWHNNHETKNIPFFSQTGLDTVKQKISRMSQDDLNNQVWIIKTVLEKEKYLAKCRITSLPNLPRKADSRSGLEIIADDTYLFIRDILHISEQEAHGLMLQPVSLDSSFYRIFETSYDLFYGISGVILFLVSYGKMFKNDEAIRIAQKAENYLRIHVQNSKDYIKTTGLFTGWGSLLLLNNRLNELYNDESYLYQNHQILIQNDFQDLIRRDNYYGLIKGNAGLVVSLCDYYRKSGDPIAKTIADCAGKSLISNLIEINGGIGWKITSSQPLSGMSHGASGFALAFLKLAQYIDNSYSDYLPRIISYENSLYNKEKGNWEDVRDYIIKTKGKSHCSAAWAHGSGGIGMMRIEMMKNGFDSAQIRLDFNRAVNATCVDGFAENLDLSFGSFGNIELLYEASMISDNPYYKKQYEDKLRMIINQYFNGNFSLGTPFKTTSLMTGITGIGYECLHLLFPNDIKSILLP